MTPTFHHRDWKYEDQIIDMYMATLSLLYKEILYVSTLTQPLVFASPSNLTKIGPRSQPTALSQRPPFLVSPACLQIVCVPPRSFLSHSPCRPCGLRLWLWLEKISVRKQYFITWKLYQIWISGCTNSFIGKCSLLCCPQLLNAAKAELSGCDGNHMAPKPSLFTIWRPLLQAAIRLTFNHLFHCVLAQTFKVFCLLPQGDKTWCNVRSQELATWIHFQ